MTLGTVLNDRHTVSHFIIWLPLWGVGDISPILPIKNLRIRILQLEKGGDKLELRSVWLRQGSLLPLLCWAPYYLLGSVTQWNDREEERILCFSILLSNRCHKPGTIAFTSCCPVALCRKEYWPSTPVCLSGSCLLSPEKPVLPWQHD